MEILFEEISSFLTRFGNLTYSDLSREWSHDLTVRFHETWSLTRRDNVLGIKLDVIFCLKRYQNISLSP